MAVKDKARVRARLTAKYPAANGFTQVRLDALAARLKATDDSTDDEIDAELEAINDNGLFTFEQIKKEDDRIANEIKKAKAAKVDAPEPEPAPEPAPSSNPELAALTKQMAELTAKLAEKEAKEAQTNLAEKFRKDERLKGIPAFVVDASLPKTEEEFEDAVTKLAENFKTFALENKLESYGKDTPPAGAGPGVPAPAGAIKEISEEEAKKLASTLLNNGI